MPISGNARNQAEDPEDFAAQLQAGTTTKFLLEIEEGVISITSDGKTIEQQLIPIRADAFVAEVRKVVGV